MGLNARPVLLLQQRKSTASPFPAPIAERAADRCRAYTVPFDSDIEDGRALLAAARGSQNKGELTDGKYFDICFPSQYLRLFDGPFSSDGIFAGAPYGLGLLVGTSIEPSDPPSGSLAGLCLSVRLEVQEQLDGIGREEVRLRTARRLIYEQLRTAAGRSNMSENHSALNHIREELHMLANARDHCENELEKADALYCKWLLASSAAASD